MGWFSFLLLLLLSQCYFYFIYIIIIITTLLLLLVSWANTGDPCWEAEDAGRQLQWADEGMDIYQYL